MVAQFQKQDFATLSQAKKQAEAKALSQLNASQRRKWNAMLGKPFEFPQAG
jgi:hypothetical protein